MRFSGLSSSRPLLAGRRTRQGLARLCCSQAATNKPLPGDFALPAASTRPPGYGRHQPGSVAAPSHGGRRRGLRRVSPPLRRPAAAVRQPRAAAPPLLPARMQPVLRLRAPLAVSALAAVAPAASARAAGPRRLLALGLGCRVLTPSGSGGAGRAEPPLPPPLPRGCGLQHLQGVDSIRRWWRRSRRQRRYSSLAAAAAAAPPARRAAGCPAPQAPS